MSREALENSRKIININMEKVNKSPKQFCLNAVDSSHTVKKNSQNSVRRQAEKQQRGGCSIHQRDFQCNLSPEQTERLGGGVGATFSGTRWRKRRIFLISHKQSICEHL